MCIPGVFGVIVWCCNYRVCGERVGEGRKVEEKRRGKQRRGGEQIRGAHGLIHRKRYFCCSTWTQSSFRDSVSN